MAGPGVVGGDYDAYSDTYATLVTVPEQGDAANDPPGADAGWPGPGTS